MTEKPLVTIGEIAQFLSVSEDKAAKMIKECKPELLEGYKPLIAVLPSDLLKALKRRPTYNGRQNNL